MIELRSPREIEQMKVAGQIVRKAHGTAAKRIQPGVTTGELDDAIRCVFEEENATPLFLGYPGPVPFPNVSCISVNEELVHGIPGERQLEEGDIVSIDTGCRIHGWCGDAAVTHPVGKIDKTAQRVMDVTEACLELAIKLLATEKFWSDIAAQMEAFVVDTGFFVVRDFVGHGIGREMHEHPQVPNFVSDSLLEDGDFEIRPGLVLAIEPMVGAGTGETVIREDQWTVATADNSFSAHFEDSVAVTRNGPIRLTGALAGARNA